MAYRVVEMQRRHGQAVLAIINHYIINDFAAFPEQPVGIAFFEGMLRRASGYPALVVKKGRSAEVGFGLLTPHHIVPTFRRTAEISYFLHPDHTRHGLGSLLLSRLLAEGQPKGVDNVLARISSHNQASLAFHQKHGFTLCGRFRRAGRKFGRDFDEVWMQKLLPA